MSTHFFENYLFLAIHVFLIKYIAIEKLMNYEKELIFGK